MILLNRVCVNDLYNYYLSNYYYFYFAIQKFHKYIYRGLCLNFSI